MAADCYFSIMGSLNPGHLCGLCLEADALKSPAVQRAAACLGGCWFWDLEAEQQGLLPAPKASHPIRGLVRTKRGVVKT